jgi:hypothetical protein
VLEPLRQLRQSAPSPFGACKPLKLLGLHMSAPLFCISLIELELSYWFYWF